MSSLFLAKILLNVLRTHNATKFNIGVILLGQSNSEATL